MALNRSASIYNPPIMPIPATVKAHATRNVPHYCSPCNEDGLATERGISFLDPQRHETVWTTCIKRFQFLEGIQWKTRPVVNPNK
jgi:hypothetical protein